MAHAPFGEQVAHAPFGVLYTSFFSFFLGGGGRGGQFTDKSSALDQFFDDLVVSALK
jgi:hypothetical protein